MKTRNKLVGGALALGAMVLIVAGSATLAADDAQPKKPARVPVPEISINKEKGDKCVEPTAVMRRDHMKFILHQRDDTMHQGLRTSKHSLKNCIECHANPKTDSVLGKDGFCESCHSYAAVSIDCFSCHSAKPEKSAKPAALVPPTAYHHPRLPFKRGTLSPSAQAELGASLARLAGTTEPGRTP